MQARLTVDEYVASLPPEEEAQAAALVRFDDELKARDAAEKQAAELEEAERVKQAHTELEERHGNLERRYETLLRQYNALFRQINRTGGAERGKAKR